MNSPHIRYLFTSLLWILSRRFFLFTHTPVHSSPPPTVSRTTSIQNVINYSGFLNSIPFDYRHQLLVRSLSGYILYHANEDVRLELLVFSWLVEGQTYIVNAVIPGQPCWVDRRPNGWWLPPTGGHHRHRSSLSSIACLFVFPLPS